MIQAWIRVSNAKLYQIFCIFQLTLGAVDACGAGFQLGEHSANAIGRALAGYGVVGDDASAVFFNPAGLVLLKRPTVQNGLFYITSRFGFENQGSRQSLSGLSVPSRGIDDDGGRDGLAPSLYALAPLGERARLALGITAPFGLLTDYDADWVGRYHALRSELKTIDINPSFGLPGVKATLPGRWRERAVRGCHARPGGI